MGHHASTANAVIPVVDPLDAMRHYIDQRLRDAEARHAERFEFAQRQLEKADQKNEARLDALGTVPGREEVMALINSVQERITGETSPLKERLERLGRTNWPLLGSMTVIVLSLISGGWMIVGLKIDAASQPMLLGLENAKANIEQLRFRTEKMSQLSAERGHLDVEQSTRIAQINEQVLALSATVNLRVDHYDQLFAILYRKAFPGDTLPATSYRPALGK